VTRFERQENSHRQLVSRLEFQIWNFLQPSEFLDLGDSRQTNSSSILTDSSFSMNDWPCSRRRLCLR